MRKSKKLLVLFLALAMVLNITPMVFADSDAYAKALIEKDIRNMEKIVVDFNQPANSVFPVGDAILGKIQVAEENGVLTAEDAEALKLTLAAVVEQARVRMNLEIDMEAPATKSVGQALHSIITNTGNLPKIVDVADNFLNTEFPAKHINYTIAQYKMYNPGKTVIPAIDEAVSNLEGWITDILVLEEISELAKDLRKKATDDLLNPPTEKPDPKPVDPDPENPGGENPGEKPGEENPDPNEVTEDDIKVFEEFGSNITMKFEDVPVITLPQLPAGYTAKVEVREISTNALLASGTSTNGGALKLKEVSSSTDISVAFEVFKVVDGKLTMSVGHDKINLLVNDTEKPVLNYAYVIDGGLILNITDESGLDKTNPIVYRVLGEDKFKTLGANYGYGTSYGNKTDFEDDFSDLFGKVNFDRYKRLDKDDYRIEVTLPSTLQIVATDKFGNRLPITIELEADNAKLTNNVPSYVDKLIESITTSSFKTTKVKDLISVTKGTTVDLFETFKSQILKEFKKFNSHDLVFSISDGDVLSGSSYKFEEEGLFQISVSHRSEAGEFIGYVNVNKKPSNVQSYKVTTNVDVKGDLFKPLIALDTKVSAKSEVSPAQFIAIIDGDYKRLDEEISFGTKTKLTATIVDLNLGKEYTVTYNKAEGSDDLDDLFGGDNSSGGVGARPTPNVNLSDINNHWARQNIQTMVSRGIVAGYEDGTFGPNNMITVRESLAIIGRVVNANPSYASTTKNGITVTGWGQAEIQASLQRLPKDIFNGSYDRAITRGEVAYVMGQALVLNGYGGGKYLSDINSSPYVNEINNLVSLGIISGMPDGTFRPNLEITRAELVTMVAKTPMYR